MSLLTEGCDVADQEVLIKRALNGPTYTTSPSDCSVYVERYLFTVNLIDRQTKTHHVALDLYPPLFQNQATHIDLINLSSSTLNSA